MNIEEIRRKYQCDEGRTFAQWKEWVRKTKPSQAQAHIVKAVAPNGSKYERLIGGYTDAQNTAFDLVSHGYKDVKLYHSVNAGPLKLLRNFSSPLHGAKFKDSADSVDEIREKYANDVYSPILGKEFSGKGKDFDKSLKEKRYEGLYKQIDFYLKHYSKQHKLSDVQMKDLKRLVNEIRSYGKNGERWVNEVKKTVKEFKDSDDFAQDKLLIAANGFGNEKGVSKKDTRKGLKPFEVAFIVKGKDGKPFKTVRSKMAASLNEAKQWANSESRKYNGVTKVEVKEFKDEADCVEMLKAKYCNDFVMKNDIVRLPNMASYNVEIKINGQPFFPMMTVRDVEGAKKDKIAKQAMEQFKKFHWNNSNSFNRPLDKSKAKLTVGKIQYKPDGRSNWEIMR